MSAALLSDPIDHLARLYVQTQALQSIELLRGFDAVAGTRLTENQAVIQSRGSVLTGPLATDVARFRAFAETALWDRAPIAVRAQLTRLIQGAVRAELPNSQAA